MALAQELLTAPRMHNLHRGLWGYSGETAGGRPLSIQSTGMGGPSAAIVLHELAELGVRRAIRVGTCGALDPTLELGGCLRVEAALPEDGVSRRLGASEPAPADPELLATLEAAGAGEPALIATTDLFYGDEDARPRWTEAGARAVEMEAAPLFVLGPRLGVRVACLLTVSDLLSEDGRERIADEPLQEAAMESGRAAAAALGSWRAAAGP
jgi:uridine phosphorylase